MPLKGPPSIAKNCKGNHLFLASIGDSYTYQDLQCFGDFFIRSLKKHNFFDSSGPIGLYAESSDTLIFIIAACWKFGIPFVSLNPKAKGAQLQQQLKTVKPDIIISDSTLAKQLDGYPTISIKELKCTKAFDKKCSAQSGSSIQVTHHEASKILGYFFTSGTSGSPKIVPLKRRQMHSAAKSSAQNLKPAPDESWLLCMPLHHIGGISVILRSLIYGSAIYRMDQFDINKITQNLSADKQIVAASLVPTMLQRLLENPTFATHKSFKAILLGGGPISTKLLEDCINRNIPVIPSYGMTETCAQIAANPILGNPSDLSVLKSVGSVFKPNEIEIRDEDEEVVVAGQSGTIWLKGPQVFDGYYNSPKTDNFDQNGWFNTGDFGRLDAERNLYIEARRTDLIITGGENVSPIEVETILREIDFIKDAAVFGVPDNEWGQIVVAAIVPGKDKLTTEDIKNILKEKLDGFKIPKDIFFVESLPRTTTGKLKRTKLLSHFKSQK